MKVALIAPDICLVIKDYSTSCNNSDPMMSEKYKYNSTGHPSGPRFYLWPALLVYIRAPLQ